jgi:protein TonB
MADRTPRSRNAPAPNPILKFLPIIIILIGLAAAAYFFIPRGSNAPTPTANAPGAPGTAPAPGTAAPAAAVPELSKEQLLKEASKALNENRLVSPPGNNALEFYLAVLQKDPKNASATDALRESFTMMTPVVEQNINNGQVDEALREIDMLAKADPNNYTLTILRGKLDAKRKQVENEAKQKEAAATAAAQRAAQPAAGAAAPTAPAATPETTAAAAPASTGAAARPAAGAPAATAAAAPPPVAAAPAPAAPAGESHPAELVKSAAPEYPREAYIKHTEGWVEVEFTITPEGSVTNASVAGSNPPRVFNEAALRAVQRWSFKPKMENGKAVEERVKRRIEFKLSAG